MMRYKHWVSLVVWLVVMGIFPLPARATMVLPMTLQSMVTKSDRILVGRVISAERDIDEQNIPATYVRFQVLDGIKGVATGDQILIKQYFGAVRHELPDGALLLTPKALGQSAFDFMPGSELVVFLYPDSRLGFTSPVGYGQGCFMVDDVTQSVTNLWQNSFLQIPRQTLQSLSLTPDAPIPLEGFLRIVRRLAGS